MRRTITAISCGVASAMAPRHEAIPLVSEFVALENIGVDAIA